MAEELPFGAVVEAHPAVPGKMKADGSFCWVRRLKVVASYPDGTIDAISAEEDRVCLVVLVPGHGERTIRDTGERAYPTMLPQETR